ncbi:hypothetical protein HS125_06930 [bacterium]|nr:hypothetical protein [bacterium]
MQVMSREGGDLPETVSYAQTYGIVNRVVSQPAPAARGRVETTFKSLNVQMTAGGATTSTTRRLPPRRPILHLAGGAGGTKYSVDVTDQGARW